MQFDNKCLTINIFIMNEPSKKRLRSYAAPRLRVVSSEMESHFLTSGYEGLDDLNNNGLYDETFD